MQKISTILNVVLLLAVAVLYYLHFSAGKRSTKKSSYTKAIPDSITAKKQVVAYVELDSLYTQVAFIKARRSEIESDQRSITANYEKAYMDLENQKNNFLKKGNAITQQEAQAFQEQLMQKQQDIEANKQANGQKLAEKGAKAMDDMQNKLKEFLNEYNSDKRYTYILATGTGLDYIFYKDSALDITPEIVKGLNEKIKVDGKP
ncbi:MAG: OmpH family outer membrane protein [Bacteroidota bacterium]